MLGAMNVEFSMNDGGFFLSDNGGVQSKPGYENEQWADNSPYRNGKGSMREGGSHVPFIAYWPKGLPSGIRYPHPVSSLDLTATAVALAGGYADGQRLDGKNLIPYVNQEVKGVPHEALFWRTASNAWCIRTPHAKLFLENHGATKPELYDMIRDPYETDNVVEQHSEVRQQLATLWNEWNENNQACYLLQSGDYQKRRLQMYEKLNAELKAKAANAKPRRVE